MLVDVWLELVFVTDDVGFLDMMVEGGDVQVDVETTKTSGRATCLAHTSHAKITTAQGKAWKIKRIIKIKFKKD